MANVHGMNAVKACSMRRLWNGYNHVLCIGKDNDMLWKLFQTIGIGTRTHTHIHTELSAGIHDSSPIWSRTLFPIALNTGHQYLELGTCQTLRTCCF